MANIVQIKPGGPVKGLTRWLVSPAQRLTEPLIRTLRPTITEYPERWPMDPTFPQPGKRSSSRPAAMQGTPEGIAAAAAATAAGQPQPPPNTDGSFPPPRPRYPVELYDANGNPATGSATGAECERPDGACFSYDFLCNAQGTTIAKVSPAIAGPFVIQHIQIATDAGAGDGIYVQVLTAPDDSLTTPLTTSGTPIITDGSDGNSRVKAFSPSIDLWPAYYERRSGQHIKVTVYQLTLLTPRSMTVSISLLLVR